MTGATGLTGAHHRHPPLVFRLIGVLGLIG